VSEQSLLERFRSRKRVLQIYDVFVHYGTDFMFDRGLIGATRRRMQQLLHRPPYRLVPLAPAVKVRLMLQELGPTYVKVGQITSSQTTALPSEWERELAKLQSDVRPFPIDEVEEGIVAELGQPLEKLFETFDTEPLAAASLAQVHRATLTDGRAVAVKVQRPNIEQQLRADVRILARAGQVLERRTVWAHQVGLAGILGEFGSNLVHELDYRGEAYNARRLARNLSSIEGVHIPEIERRLSARRVLTMEFIEGVKISDVDVILAARLDPAVLAQLGLRAAIKMLLIDGFFHADPHPGNVLVELDKGRVVFLDAGMVGELGLRQRAYLVNLLYVTSRRDAVGLAQTLRTLSEPFRRVDDKAFYADFERRVGRYLEPGERIGFAPIMTAALDVLRDNGLRLDPQLTLAIKALTQAEAFARSLFRSGLDPVEQPVGQPADMAAFIQPAVQMVEELVAETVTPELVAEVAKKQLAFVGREIVGQLPSLQEATGSWIKQYKKGKITVKLDTSDLDEQLETAGTYMRVVTAGLLLAGTAISAAIVTGAGETSEGALSFVSDFARVIFVASVILALIVVVAIVLRFVRRRRDDVF
jgi:ubiquinone biosynthesis protein